jgi:hypothetical protein
MSRIRLKYVQAWVDREGRVHRYFRRRGYPRVPLPGLPGSFEFMAAYQAALAGPRTAIGAERWSQSISTRNSFLPRRVSARNACGARSLSGSAPRMVTGRLHCCRRNGSRPYWTASRRTLRVAGS